jgi:hypothetical protein
MASGAVTDGRPCADHRSPSSRSSPALNGNRASNPPAARNVSRATARLFDVKNRPAPPPAKYEETKSARRWLVSANTLSGRALTVRPPTSASGLVRSTASNAVSQPASGRQSSSVNASHCPRAEAAPVLRADAGPALRCSTTRSSSVASLMALTTSSAGGLPPSFTIRISSEPPGRSSARNARTHAASGVGRSKVGTMTVKRGPGRRG